MLLFLFLALTVIIAMRVVLPTGSGILSVGGVDVSEICRLTYPVIRLRYPNSRSQWSDRTLFALLATMVGPMTLKGKFLAENGS